MNGGLRAIAFFFLLEPRWRFSREPAGCSRAHLSPEDLRGEMAKTERAVALEPVAGSRGAVGTERVSTTVVESRSSIEQVPETPG
jgi:hypothetical protein